MKAKGAFGNGRRSKIDKAWGAYCDTDAATGPSIWKAFRFAWTARGRAERLGRLEKAIVEAALRWHRFKGSLPSTENLGEACKALLEAQEARKAKKGGRK